MSDLNILPKDQNFVRAAGFESDSTPGLVMAGQIDEVTGRILVDNAGGGGAATEITVANEATDTTCFPVFVPGATGNQEPKTNAGLTFNSNTARFNATILASSSLTASEIVITDASKNLVSATVATYPSLTELTYLKGVTSAIQTQLNAKAAALSGTANEIAYFNSTTTITSLTTATYPSLTELSYVKGVTSALQTQLNAKQATITFGTGVQTALGVNIGSAGAPVLFNGALGTPSSGTLTNATGLPTAGLVDDAVTLAKMAPGTDGNLITYDANGDPAYVATGTSGQVLTSNGAGAAPTFQTSSGAELVVSVFPGMGVLEVATLGVNASGELPTIRFADGVSNAIWHQPYRVPASANGKSISQVRIHYQAVGTTDRNLYIASNFYLYPSTNNSARVSDSDGARAYATGTSTTTNHMYIDINSAAYNGIGVVATGDLLMFDVNRQGADVLDTYGQIWYVFRIDITFA